MKTKLLSLAMAVLAIPIVAHALTFPSPPGVCKNDLLKEVANFVLALLQLGQIC
jgi:hypothetical protein